ncbi:S8 family peptidase [Bdellovibrionota bacterium FG-1]
MNFTQRATGLAGIFAASVLMMGAASASEYRAGELIVKYRDGVSRSRLEMNSLYDTAGVKNVRHFSGIMKGLDHVILNENVNLEDAMAAFMSNPSVEYAQPNYILHTFPTARHTNSGGIPCIPGFDIPGCEPGGAPGAPGGGDGGTPCIFPGVPFPPGCQDGGQPGEPGNPNPTPTDTPPPAASRPDLMPAPADVTPPVADPDLDKAYGMKKIGAVDAWTTYRGSSSFIVADIDTGIDYNHEDISFNLWRSKDESGKEFSGYDFVHNDTLPFDDNEHGTHTAGTIGAVGGNGKGVSGVAQRVSIMALKFLSGEGSGTTADAIRAVDYAIGHGAKVLSNSWGGKGDDGNQALKDAVERARLKDVLFIAAAGNDGTDNDGSNPSYPAAFDNDNMISVAATDDKDGLAFFSNYGKKTTHLAAPGVNVYSTIPGNKYAKLSGTSMACPHVAGAAALLWSKHPEWNYKKVKEVLLGSTDKVAALAGKTVTGGRLNILNALRSRE